MIQLSPEELGEIAEFARKYPETIPQMKESPDPRTLLERVREALREINNADQEEQDGPISEV